MKKLLLILAMVFLVQNMAYAEEGRGKGKRFEENKGRVLESIGKKIGFLNNFKTCVISASSREELKSCRMTNKKTMEEFRATKKVNKEERQQLRAERKEEREKRRAARDQRREN
jgi:hypothetical protein